MYSTLIQRGGSSLLFSIVHDITARKRAERALQLVANVFTHARDDAIGMTPRLFKSHLHAPKFYEAMWRTLRDTDQWNGEIWNRRKNGEAYADIA